MYLTVHVAAGVTIGSFLSNPTLAFGTALVSHLVLDAVPHHDPQLPAGENRARLMLHPLFQRFLVVAGIDLLLTAALLGWLLATFTAISKTVLLASAAGAMLPDFIHGLAFITGHPKLRWYHRFHDFYHCDEDKIRRNPVLGLATQIVALTISLVLLFRAL